VRRLLALAKIHEGLDEPDPYSEHLIQLEVIEGLEEEPGDCSPLLKLVLNRRWIKISRRRGNAIDNSYQKNTPTTAINIILP